MKLFKSAKEDRKYLKQEHKVLNFLLNTLVLALSVGFIILTTFTILLKVIPGGSWVNIVDGDSMVPTLHNHQILFSSDEEPDYGDYVVSYFPEALIKLAPEKKSETIIKRVIGLPGDLVEIHEDGTILINHKKLDQPYLSEEAIALTYKDGLNNRVQLGPTDYFLLGDNRGNSYDSRYFGPVSKDDLLYIQSEHITRNAIIKTAYVFLYILVIVGVYTIIDAVVFKIAYKWIKRKTNQK